MSSGAAGSLAGPRPGEVSGPVGMLAEQLADVLGTQLGAGTRVLNLSRLAGGASYETWAFDAWAGGDPTDVRELVLRREVEQSVLQLPLDREFELLGILHARGVRVARPLVHVARSTAESAFMITDRVPGTDVRKHLAREGVADRRALGRELVAAQVSIHQAVRAGDAAEVLGTAPDEDPVAVEIDRWERIVVEDTLDPQPLLRAGLGWLRAHAVTPQWIGLVHGDFKANNLLHGGRGLAAVLDWELAHLGDPVEDLGWTMLWRTEWDLVGGLLSEAEYVAVYEELAGVAVDPDALTFWRLFALVKLAAVFMIQGGRDTITSATPTLAMMGRAIPWVERTIAEFLAERAGEGSW